MLVPPSRAHVQILYPSFDSSSSEGSRAAHHDAKPCFGGEGDDDGNWVVKAAGRAAPRKISPLRDGQDKIFAGHKKVRRSSKRACGHRGRGHLRHLPSPPNHQDPDYKVRCHSEDTITRLFMSCVVLLVSTICLYVLHLNTFRNIHFLNHSPF